MKVACVLANGFEDSEFKQPYDALREAGHDVTIVGLEAGKELKGDKGRETATVEKAFADASPDDFEALFIPAGAYRDHRMTAWKTIQSDLKLLGANVVDQEVVVDRNLVTSRQPQDIPAFIREGLKLLEKVPAVR